MFPYGSKLYINIVICNVSIYLVVYLFSQLFNANCLVNGLGSIDCDVRYVRLKRIIQF